jgi:hypothetical protein
MPNTKSIIGIKFETIFVLASGGQDRSCLNEIFLNNTKLSRRT